MHIGYLPLDERPCNRDFPMRLCEISGDEGVPLSLEQVLTGALPEIDALVVSLDALAFGGLLPSRTLKISTADAAQRLQVLVQIRREKPRLSVFGVGVCLRLPTVGERLDERDAWRAMSEWASLLLRTDEASAARRRELERSIPDDAVQNYRELRRRNHDVNMRSLRLVEDGTLDGLFLMQDDATEEGPHKPELEELRRAAAELRRADRVHILTGCDEGLVMATARVLLRDKKPTVRALLDDPRGLSRVPLDEAEPLGRNISSHVAACGALETRDAADLELFVFCPRSPDTSRAAIDLFLEEQPPLPSSETLRSWTDHLDLLGASIAGGRFSAVADLVHVNGADPTLTKDLLERVDPTDLVAWAGWNTAANSIGSALAEGLATVAGRRTGRFRAAAARRHRWERIADDFLYQSVIRSSIRGAVEVRREKSPNDVRPQIEEWIRTFLAERVPDLAKVRVEFPCNRIFEIRIVPE